MENTTKEKTTPPKFTDILRFKKLSANFKKDVLKQPHIRVKLLKPKIKSGKQAEKNDM